MPINIITEMQAGVLPDVNNTQLFLMDVERFLDSLPEEPIFDLVVTSPPYNIGKEYENQMPLTDYVAWQKRIIEKIYPRLKKTGSICWQVGNYVENGSITPLDIELAPIFKSLNMNLRNRIIWHYHTLKSLYFVVFNLLKSLFFNVMIYLKSHSGGISYAVSEDRSYN